jgi:hypothetical protein
MAGLLAGSWRESPPPAEDGGTLDELAPLLHRSGAAALAWARLRHRSGDIQASALQDAYRLQRLSAVLQRRHIAIVLEAFRAHGVEPVLIKGWAAARLYPDEALRPSGDIDLAVPAEDEDQARRALVAITADCAVDLHVGIRFLDDRPRDEVQRRCEEVALDGTRVRVLGREDHIRLLAVHMLGHGAWRPSWLVDIAVALETRPARFDWDWFQAGSPRRTQWAVAALGLAHSLLGAEMTGVPAALAPAKLPPWAARAVLEAWGDESPRPAAGARLPMRQVRDPIGVLRALWDRWPSPLEATVGTGASISSFPRWPLQLAECAARVGRFARMIVGEGGEPAHTRLPAR